MATNYCAWDTNKIANPPKLYRIRWQGKLQNYYGSIDKIYSKWLYIPVLEGVITKVSYKKMMWPISPNDVKNGNNGFIFWFMESDFQIEKRSYDSTNLIDGSIGNVWTVWLPPNEGDNGPDGESGFEIVYINVEQVTFLKYKNKGAKIVYEDTTTGGIAGTCTCENGEVHTVSQKVKGVCTGPEPLHCYNGTPSACTAPVFYFILKFSKIFFKLYL